MEGNRNEEQEKGAEIRAILSFRDRSFIRMEVLQMQISASPREIFPLLRQLLYDAVQTDALLFTWPYENV